MRYFLLLLFLILPFTTKVGEFKQYIYEIECHSIDDIVLNEYLNSIGFRESSGRYDAVNSFGFMGKYQFSPVTLIGLGFDVNMDEFLSTPELQDSAMITLLHHNYNILRNLIDVFDGEEFNDVTITKSGILAAAHLVGPYRTRLLLQDNINTEDAYGTTAMEYLISFSGYNINLQP
jgi:hypothetical protein